VRDGCFKCQSPPNGPDDPLRLSHSVESTLAQIVASYALQAIQYGRGAVAGPQKTQRRTQPVARPRRRPQPQQQRPTSGTQVNKALQLFLQTLVILFVFLLVEKTLFKFIF